MPFLVIWILFGVGCANDAGNKNRSVPGWFFLGLLLGPFGLLFILLLSPMAAPAALRATIIPAYSSPEQIPLDQETKQCPHCAETIKLEAKKCRFCLETIDPDQVASEVAGRRTQLAAKYALEALGKKQCPRCLQWDVHRATIEGGGQGDWCPHCQISLQKLATLNH